MKKTAAAAAVLAAVMIFSLACSARIDGAPDGMKLISTEDVEYYLYVPQEWVEDISTGVVTAYVSETDRSNISLAAFDLEDPNTTPAAFWEKYEEDLRSTFPSAVFGEASSAVVDGAFAAEQRTFKAEISGSEYEFLETVFIRAGVAYILTYTALSDKFDSHLDDVRDIISAIRFR